MPGTLGGTSTITIYKDITSFGGKPSLCRRFVPSQVGHGHALSEHHFCYDDEQVLKIVIVDMNLGVFLKADLPAPSSRSFCQVPLRMP